jgi:transcriptional regulator GlxA family with amidase domain
VKRNPGGEAAATLLFRRAVVLTPKVYTRVLRFQRTLQQMATDPRASCAALALAVGYSDQPHFNREFREPPS